MSLKKLTLLIGWVSFFISVCSSQNLIPNGGFEEYVNCPNDDSQFNDYIKDWFTFFSTPDFRHECGYNPDFESRNNSEGFITLKTYRVRSTNTEREYVHNRLERPLKAGETIFISYWINQSSYSYLIDQWSFYFSEEPTEVYPDSGNLYIELPSQVNWTGGPIRDTNNYVQLQGCYTAKGGEEYFCFGNFVQPEEVKVDSMVPMGKRPQGNFVAIDDMQMISQKDIHYDSIELCTTDSFFFIDYYDLGLYATYEDDTLLNGFLPRSSGTYLINIHIPQCGVIDTLKVIYKECFKCYFTDYNDISICLLDSFNAKPLLETGVGLRIGSYQLPNKFNPGQLGTYKVIVFNNTCDSIDQFFLSFVECENCALEFTSIELCPSDDIESIVTEPYYINDVNRLSCPGTYTVPILHKDCPNPIDTMEIIVRNFESCFDLSLSDTFCVGEEPMLPDINPLSYGYITSLPDTFREPGNYHFSILSENCNQEVTSGSLVVIECGECPIYIPNIFTPNNDEINDVFRVYSNCQIIEFKATIYDRFGNLIIESRNINNIWDGNGYNPGVYVYRVKVTMPDREGDIDFVYHGTITLTR